MSIGRLKNGFIRIMMLALCIGIGFSVSSCRKLEKENKKHERSLANEEIQSHIMNRDYKAAFVKIKSSEVVSAKNYVESFIVAEEYDMAHQLIQDYMSNPYSRKDLASSMSKIVVVFYKNGNVDFAYSTAEAYLEENDKYNRDNLATPLKALLSLNVSDLCKKGKIKEAKALVKR